MDFFDQFEEADSFEFSDPEMPLNLDDVEASTPLEERLLVDQDLYRERRDNLKTYSRRAGKLSKSPKILLERCDLDDLNNSDSAVPLKEITQDASIKRSRRSLKTKSANDDLIIKKSRVEPTSSNDENESTEDHIVEKPAPVIVHDNNSLIRSNRKSQEAPQVVDDQPLGRLRKRPSNTIPSPDAKALPEKDAAPEEKDAQLCDLKTSDDIPMLETKKSTTELKENQDDQSNANLEADENIADSPCSPSKDCPFSQGVNLSRLGSSQDFPKEESFDPDVNMETEQTEASIFPQVQVEEQIESGETQSLPLEEKMLSEPETKLEKPIESEETTPKERVTRRSTRSSNPLVQIPCSQIVIDADVKPLLPTSEPLEIKAEQSSPIQNKDAADTQAEVKSSPIESQDDAEAEADESSSFLDTTGPSPKSSASKRRRRRPRLNLKYKKKIVAPEVKQEVSESPEPITVQTDSVKLEMSTSVDSMLPEEPVDNSLPVEPEVSPFKTPSIVLPKTPTRRSTRLSSDLPILNNSSLLESTLETSAGGDDDSSDDDTSWNDSLECIELPNRPSSRMSLGLESIDTDFEIKCEECCPEDLSALEDLEDKPLQESKPEPEDESLFEFRKGDAVLAKLGKWPPWPAFVVPFEDSYRRILRNKPAFHVVFCGQHERAWIPIVNLERFTSFEDYQNKPEKVQVPPNKVEKWEAALNELLKYKETPSVFVEEYEVKIPEPEPPGMTSAEREELRRQLRDLKLSEREREKLLRREARAREIERNRLRRQEQKELARKLREEARSQIVRNVCIQCRDHTNYTPVVKCTQCEFYYHASCQPRDESDAFTDFVCSFCKDNNMPCFVCFKHDEGMLKCKVNKCNKRFHFKCLSLHWQQATMSGQDILVSCPAHSCHSCIHRDIMQFKKVVESREKLVRCTKCPATYHKDEECIPASAIRINSHQIVCPRHHDHQNKPKTNLCQMCVKPFTRKELTEGSVWVCQVCPCMFHTSCLDADDAEMTRDGFACLYCCDGFFPKYEDRVWAKLGSSRWWPAKILSPKDIPERVLGNPHTPDQFVVQFYGTKDYSWISNKSTFLMQSKEDVPSYTLSSQKDLKFAQGVTDALAELSERELFLDQKVGLYYLSKLENKPGRYNRIKNNFFVPPCKPFKEMDCDIGPCRCKPTDPDPCGDGCENRGLRMECDKDCPCGDKCQNKRIQLHQDAPTELKFMGSKGFGLVSKEDLKPGTFIIEYVGEVLTKEEFKRRRQAYVENKESHFYFLELSGTHYIDAKSKGNLSRFINHSCDPNCQSSTWYANNERRIGLFTLRDVKAGEELTFNYGWEKDGSNNIQQCLCGAEKCQNFLAAEKNRKSVATPVVPTPKTIVKGKTSIRKSVAKEDIIEVKDACEMCSSTVKDKRRSSICTSCYENKEF